MPTVKILNLTSTEVGEIELADTVFGVALNEPLIHEAVRSFLANRRAGTSATKTRGDVSGSGRKLWKQKGTGRARMGSIRSPLWRHGGTTHGPQPRDYSYKLPRKMQLGALRSALSAKLRDGELRIVSDPPLIQTVEELLPGPDGEAVRASIHDLLRQYRSTLERDRREALEGFRIVDAARRVGGVGSVGTRAWIVLMLGRDEQDPLFLQLKESERSVLEGFLRKSRYRHHGQRVVSGQRLMQASSDIFLGWQHVDSGIDGRSRDFYMRQLHDWKGSVEVEQMIPEGLVLYGRLCGWTLARAHARSGDRIAIAAYLGAGDSFDRALVSFAEAYADQNERDYAALVDAAKRGRVEAETGV